MADKQNFEPVLTGHDANRSSLGVRPPLLASSPNLYPFANYAPPGSQAGIERSARAHSVDSLGFGYHPTETVGQNYHQQTFHQNYTPCRSCESSLGCSKATIATTLDSVELAKVKWKSKIVTITCAFVMLLLIIGTVFGIVLYLNPTKPEESVEMCFPCSHRQIKDSLGDGSVTIKRMRHKRSKEKQTQCCKTVTGKEAETIRQKYITTQTTEKKVEQSIVTGLPVFPGNKFPENFSISNIKAAAHLQLDLGALRHTYNIRNKDHLHRYTIHSWEKVLLQNVELDQEGFLKILQSGLYYIYGQAHFFAQSGWKTYQAKSAVHYLFKFNSTTCRSEMLQQSPKARTLKETEVFEVTSYLGGVYRLKRGDHVMMKVNNVTLLEGGSEVTPRLHSNPKSTFLGLYMIEKDAEEHPAAPVSMCRRQHPSRRRQRLVKLFL